MHKNYANSFTGAWRHTSTQPIAFKDQYGTPELLRAQLAASQSAAAAAAAAVAAAHETTTSLYGHPSPPPPPPPPHYHSPPALIRPTPHMAVGLPTGAFEHYGISPYWNERAHGPFIGRPTYSSLSTGGTY